MDPSKITYRTALSSPHSGGGQRAAFLGVATSCFLFGIVLISNAIGSDEAVTTISSQTTTENDQISETKFASSEAFQNQGSIDPTLSPVIADTSRRLFQTTPASKMTIRRDPPKNRFLGGDEANGLSIRTIQEELNKADEKNDPDKLPPMFATSGWSLDEPYGKYLYIHHAPLLFEDIPAERYGDVCSPCFQPVVGFAKFMGTVPFLPYKIATNYYAAYHEDGVCAIDCHGNLRPGILEGSYFPTREVFTEYPRSNLVGGLTEAGTVTGLIFLFP